MQATVEVDQTQLNRLFLNLVRIGEKHGVRFPREFGLFLKQVGKRGGGEEGQERKGRGHFSRVEQGALGDAVSRWAGWGSVG